MVFAYNTQAVGRFPMAFQIVWSALTICFSIGVQLGACMKVFWPGGVPISQIDTPRYLYPEDQDAEGDALLERLYEKSIDEPVVI